MGDYWWTVEMGRWGNGGMIESNEGIEQNDGVKEERLKVIEGVEGRHYTGQIQPSQPMPPEQPFDKGPRTIYTKTNEITGPRGHLRVHICSPPGVSFPKP